MCSVGKDPGTCLVTPDLMECETKLSNLTSNILFSNMVFVIGCRFYHTDVSLSVSFY